MKTHTPLKLFYLALLLIAPLVAKAQLAATLISPGSTVLSLQQLGQLQLINPGAAMKANIRMVLVRKGGERLLTADYYNIHINPGAQLLQLGQKEPGSKVYGSSKEASVLSTSGRLAFGNYSLCVLISETTLPQEPLENCINFEITPLTPPILIFPADKSEIVTSQPLLSWLPPAPMTEGISYKLKLCRIDSGQTALDALLRNPIIFQESSIPINSKVYPPTATPLNPGQKYAWQVEAFYGDASLGITEVWEFTYKKLQETEIKPEQTSWFRAKKIQDGTYCIAEPVLKILIPDARVNQKADFKILDAAGKEVKLYKRSTSRLALKAGDNFFEFNLNDIATFEHDKFYFMHLHAGAERYYIAFQFVATPEN